MSQNMRAEWWWPELVVHGRIWNVDGSGCATVSDSETRANPSMEEPSKPMPSSKAPSSSAGAIATDLRNPSTSVNHSRTKRISRSSSVRSTNSFCRSMSVRVCNACYFCVTGATLAAAFVPRAGLLDEVARHRRVDALLAGEHHGVLTAVEGDQRR